MSIVPRMRAPLLLLSPIAVALACGADPSAPAGLSPADAAAGPVAAPVLGGAAAVVPALALERLDADPSCDGVVPAAAPAPLAASRTVAPGATCLGATADGTGHVALASTDATGVTTVQAFAADGAPAGTFSAEGLTPLVPQDRGFHALASAGGGAAVRYVVLAPEGTLARSTPLDAPDLTALVGRVAPDPAGGALLLSRGTHVSGNHWFELAAARVDDAGATVAGPARVASGSDPGGPAFFAGAVSTSGAALALFGEAGALRVQWLGRDGAPAAAGEDGAAADAGLGPGTFAELAPLLDGGVALRAGEAWRRAWAPLATAGTAAPAWLSERPGTRLRIVRGGTAYALVPDPSPAAAGCAQRVELRNAAGRLCGAATVTRGAGECATGRLEVGRDGTLVQQTPPAQERCTSGGCTCSAAFFSGLLR